MSSYTYNLSEIISSLSSCCSISVCPCWFLSLKDPGSSETVEPEGCLNASADSGSPKRHFQEGAKEEQVSWGVTPAHTTEGSFDAR